MNQRLSEETYSILKRSGLDRNDVAVVQVLRDGEPNWVLRVKISRNATGKYSPYADTLIVKSCSSSSLEPEVTVWAKRVLDCVPQVYRTIEGASERIVVMEDMGERLWNHGADEATYIAVSRDLARIHSKMRGKTDLHAPLEFWDRSRWTSLVGSAAMGTLERFSDGTYATDNLECMTGLQNHVREAAAVTLRALERHRPLLDSISPTLTHGDFHEGNIVLKGNVSQRSTCYKAIYGVLDWASARWDTGLHDLVTLIDVATRMKTVQLDETRILTAYLEETRRLGADSGVTEILPKVWNLSWVLRAWEELCWFSETRDNFGERALREIRIIQKRLSSLELE